MGTCCSDRCWPVDNVAILCKQLHKNHYSNCQKAKNPKCISSLLNAVWKKRGGLVWEYGYGMEGSEPRLFVKCRVGYTRCEWLQTLNRLAGREQNVNTNVLLCLDTLIICRYKKHKAHRWVGVRKIDHLYGAPHNPLCRWRQYSLCVLCGFLGSSAVYIHFLCVCVCVRFSLYFLMHAALWKYQKYL